MSDRVSKRFFAVECKRTCWGGSEKGTCSCKSPTDCHGQDKPGWEEAKQEAQDRMGRFLRNAVTKEKENP